MEQKAAPPTTPTNSLFVYGTLRPDRGACGDDWAALRGCTWFPARVEGFALYQDPGHGFPFAVECAPSVEDAVVVGTVIMYPSVEGHALFTAALQRCDGIEGYIKDAPADSLYQRTAVRARLQGPPSVSNAETGASAPVPGAAQGSWWGKEVAAYMYVRRRESG